VLIFYDPARQNQVMALYTGGTTSEEWERRGYIAATVPDDLAQDVARLGRDAKVTIKKGEITGVSPLPNPEQPQRSPRDVRLRELHGRLENDTITPKETREMLRLERGL